MKGVKPRSAKDEGGAEAAAYGRFVDEHVVATNHDHFLNFRLDLDVDGPVNSFVADQIVAKSAGKGPRKSICVTEPTTMKREQEGRLHMSMEKPALWRVTNPAVTGRAGYPVSYELEPGHNAMNLLSADDYPSKRAGFAAHTLWVTQYSPSERWAGGDYPNGSPKNPIAERPFTWLPPSPRGRTTSSAPALRLPSDGATAIVWPMA